MPQLMPAARMPLVDPVSGKVSTVWYRFFGVLFERLGGAMGPGTEDLQQDGLASAGLNELQMDVLVGLQAVGQNPPDFSALQGADLGNAEIGPPAAFAELAQGDQSPLAIPGVDLHGDQSPPMVLIPAEQLIDLTSRLSSLESQISELTKQLNDAKQGVLL